ncbi:MAG: histidinol-phosphate transaminase, partial [Acidobacteria bacterium]|nr:histidinol-phosphate transaminase [Acidobacteriota bacterium]
REGKLRLDFNENTVGCSPRVLRALRRLASRERLSLYPEYEAVRQKLAAFFNVAPDALLFTNGTDEAIQLVVNTYVDDNEPVALLSPSFPMYRFYAQAAGAVITEVPFRRPDLTFPRDELLSAITPETRAVLIANPNNPTGTAVDLADVHRILEKAQNAAVLIDEAYFEFHGTTALGLIPHYPNLFVSRTFSKVYGLAGLRLGCLLSQPENIAYLHKAQSPYSVNSLAVICAAEAVEDRAYIERYAAEVVKAREQLCRGLRRLKVPYAPSAGNFVLAHFGDRAKEVCIRLREAGILVRDRSFEIPGSVRVTVGNRAQVRRFLAALREVL